MKTLLKSEYTYENIEICDERELMFTAWDRHKELSHHAMPEVDLVQRILNLPNLLKPDQSKTDAY